MSLAAVRLGYPLLDPIGAFLVAVFIARTGLEIFRETSPILADRAVLDEEGIRRVVMSVPGVVGCHQIRSRGSPTMRSSICTSGSAGARRCTKPTGCRTSSRIA